jgi:hypothetical protein
MDQSHSVACGDKGCTFVPLTNQKGRGLSTYDQVYTIPLEENQPIVEEEIQVQQGEGITTRQATRNKRKVPPKCRKTVKKPCKRKQNVRRKKC